MTLILNRVDWDELCQQAPRPCYPNQALDNSEVCLSIPNRLGQGYMHNMELCPGVWLSLSSWEFYQDWMLKMPAHDHIVQCLILLSGLIHDLKVYPTIGGERSYFSGSGIAPSHIMRFERSQRIVMVDIHLLPEVLEQFFSEITVSNAALLKLLLKQNGWKVAFFPTVTAEMQRVAQQIWTAPFCGTTRRLYLQTKVFDLLELQLQSILSDPALSQPPPGRKPETIARIYHAREVLASRLENPPSLFDLAQEVGVSDRTLRRGFQNVFGTTVVGYLSQQRMKQAEQLLREGKHTVAEVANQVGYAHLGHFAAGFKRQFGISPRECLTGKNSVVKMT
jgi:AraC-like DNA-binding protein